MAQWPAAPTANLQFSTQNQRTFQGSTLRTVRSTQTNKIPPGKAKQIPTYPMAMGQVDKNYIVNNFQLLPLFPYSPLNLNIFHTRPEGQVSKKVNVEACFC